MDTIELKRYVMLKVIMTPEFRQQLIDEAGSTVSRIQENLEIIENEGEKQIAQAGDDEDQVEILKDQLERDKAQLQQMKSELAWKIKEVENLADGAEVPFQVFEGTVSVNVGDDIREKMAKTEIIVKDWKVVEIRNN